MAENSVNVTKENLKDSELMTRFFYEMEELTNVALTLQVKNYSKLKKNVIYYISSKIENYRWTYKLFITNGTLFTFLSTNANLMLPEATVSKGDGDYVTNYENDRHEGLMISAFCHKAITNPENKYLQSGSLIIEFNYEIDNSGNIHCSLQSEIDAGKYWEIFKELYLPPPDIKIIVRGGQFWSYKAVLSARSKFFAKFFENNQSSSNRNFCISVNEDANIFRNVLMYMTNRELDYKDEEDMIEIYRIANILEIDLLKNNCMDYFKANFSPSNKIGILSKASLYGLTELKNAVVQYMIKNGAKMLHISQFLTRLRP